MNMAQLSLGAAISVLALGLSGCGISTINEAATQTGSSATAATQYTGTVYGGSTPIVGANIAVYAVGTTGYGSASQPILNSGVTVTTDASGKFALGGKYTCPASSSLVYILASGGNAGANGPNNALRLMAALGKCGNFVSNPTATVAINEVSTTAAVWALQQFMSGPTSIGAPSTNATGIANAFGDVGLLANLATGISPGTTPTYLTIPSSTINTIANILSTCINSNGSTSSGTGCGTLFTNTTVNNVTPTDTITAALNMAKAPAANVASLFALVPSTGAPFQPTLASAPANFTLSATFATIGNAVADLANDASGNVWLRTGRSITVLTPQFSNLVSPVGSGGATAIAIDQTGNLWGARANSLLRLTPTGTSTAVSTNSSSSPNNIAIDGLGQIWTGNANGTLTGTTPAGASVTGTPFTLPKGAPRALAISPF